MPLIMEPMSAFYSSPLVVLDFQSLYPSVMIAYNYCYSTCLGRVAAFRGQFRLGVTTLDIAPGLLETLKELITGEHHTSIRISDLMHRYISRTKWHHVYETTSAQRTSWPHAR